MARTMTFRGWLKYRLYGTLGNFSYCGTRVYFPRGSLAFWLACEQGIFEASNVRLLQAICRCGGYMFDVGANLGLMAVPVLKAVPDSRVVSFEPSPNSLPWLRSTIAGAGFGERWRLVEKAVGRSSGSADFNLSRPQDGLFDGLRPTGRAAAVASAKIEMTTLDREWEKIGRPPIAAIKIDVEGSELDVLQGATACLNATRAAVLTEWNATNLVAYDVEPSALLELAESVGYVVYALPFLVPVRTASELRLQMIGTESFLLLASQ